MRTALLLYRNATTREGVRIDKGEQWSANAIFSYAVRNGLVYRSDRDFVAHEKVRRPSCKSEYKWLRDGGGVVFVEFDFCFCCGRGEVREYTYGLLRYIEDRKRDL